jgi:hypothetical protein
LEAVNAAWDQFGKDPLLAALARGRTADLPDSLPALWQDFEGWCGPIPRRDDISVLAMEFAERGPRKARGRQRVPATVPGPAG